MRGRGITLSAQRPCQSTAGDSLLLPPRPYGVLWARARRLGSGFALSPSHLAGIEFREGCWDICLRSAWGAANDTVGVPPSKDPMPLCPNCGTDVATRFCGSCGQRQSQLGRRIGAYVGEVFAEMVSADGRLANTLTSLLIRPGHLTLEWTRGRRRSYTHPFRLYLFAALLFFSMWQLSTPDESLLFGSVTALTSQSDFGGDREAVIEATAQRVVDLLPLILIILLVPIFATVSRAVLGRRGDYLETHLVFAFHMHTVLFVLLVASQPFRSSNWIDDWALIGAISTFAIYVLLAAHRAFPRDIWATVLRASAALFLYLMVFWATVIITSQAVLDFAVSQ